MVKLESEPSARRGRGRPRNPEHLGKRHPFGFRTTTELREKLGIAAGKSGRSMAQEIEARLERSFLVEDIEAVLCDLFDAAVLRHVQSFVDLSAGKVLAADPHQPSQQAEMMGQRNGRADD